MSAWGWADKGDCPHCHGLCAPEQRGQSPCARETRAGNRDGPLLSVANVAPYIYVILRSSEGATKDLVIKGS